jgi:RNase P/RNase MRP subunit p30
LNYINLYTGLDAVENLKKLGWSRLCVSSDFSGNSHFKGFREKVGEVDKDLLVGARISGDMRKNARKALDAGADLIIADGRTNEDCRRASECWEVDLIVNPELNEARDMLDQWNSGLDNIITSYMAEREIGYCINIDNILKSKGIRRTRLVGRIRQNLKLARKYKVKTILSCGFDSGWYARSPIDLIQFGKTFGLTNVDARDSVTKNPSEIVERVGDRNNPNIIMSGLEVLEWGHQKRKPKRKYGWY